MYNLFQLDKESHSDGSSGSSGMDFIASTVHALSSDSRTTTTTTSSNSGVSDVARLASMLHIASLYRHEGLHEDAANTYETILASSNLDVSQRIAVMVKALESMSFADKSIAESSGDKYVDLVEAQLLAQGASMDPTGAGNIDSAVELEKKDLPRKHHVHYASSGMATAASASATASGASPSAHSALDPVSSGVQQGTSALRRKRTPEQKAKRKAVLRKAYLLGLQALGKYDPNRPSKPDPER
jgi:hypothetical protein